MGYRWVKRDEPSPELLTQSWEIHTLSLQGVHFLGDTITSHDDMFTPSVNEREPIHKTEASKNASMVVSGSVCRHGYLVLFTFTWQRRWSGGHDLACYLYCVIEHSSWMLLGVL